MSLQYLLNEKFPYLVLHNICDFLNLPELKAFRLVCVQWHNVGTLHIRNQAHLKLNTRKHEKFKLAISKISGEQYPVRNLKLSFCPIQMGCKCRYCYDPWFPVAYDRTTMFDESSIHAIVAKCSSGIKSLYLKELDHMPETHSTVNIEQLLLREEFRILKELCVHVPFKVTKDSGISAIFRNLTSLKLSHRCCEDLFTSNLFKACRFLKSIVITLQYYNYGDPFVGIVRILNAIKHAKNENQYLLNIQELYIRTSPFPWTEVTRFTLTELTTLLIKIRELNFKFKVLHVQIGHQREWRELLDAEKQLKHEMLNLLESQKDTLVSLIFPDFPNNPEIGLRDFPRMKNLKKLQTYLDLGFPLIQCQQKLPHLQSLKLEYYRFTEIPPNIIPCETLEELQLDETPINMENVFRFNRIFPNVRYLTIVLHYPSLHTFWGIWPRLTELSLTVEYHEDRFFARGHNNPYEEHTGIHAGLIGMPVNECEALLESAVPFLSLTEENYNYNLPSIRDLSELRKLSLNCRSTCNIELMLGILPMKSLTEVSVIQGEMTIDCVQHLLRYRPNITRWEFNGICSLDDLHRYFYETRDYPMNTVKWTISSRNDMKHQPSYDDQRSDGYKTRLRSIKNFGKGRSLYWLPKTCHVRPSPYVFK